MATIQQIRDAMHRAPFTPFVVRVADGQEFTIRHPDFISVSPDPRGRAVVIHEDRRVHQLDVLVVTSLEYADPSTAEPAGGNGAGD